MWIVGAVIEGAFVIFVGFVMLPAVKLLLDTLNEDLVQSLPGLTALESVVMGFYPMAVFLAILLGAVSVFRRTRKRRK